MQKLRAGILSALLLGTATVVASLTSREFLYHLPC